MYAESLLIKSTACVLLCYYLNDIPVYITASRVHVHCTCECVLSARGDNHLATAVCDLYFQTLYTS